ncbi:MAG: hypothetical protein MZV64_59750 [Ignavibacteriales bacterium]|nr:hypothetical protein [Ignavibacteriales bacterium]
MTACGSSAGMMMRVAGLQVERLAGDPDLGLAVEHMHERIEGGGVLAQFLVLVEGKERDVARLRLGDLAADHGTFVVGNQVRHVKGF